MKNSILRDLYSHYDRNLPLRKRAYIRMRLKIIPVDEYRRLMKDSSRVLSLGCSYGLAEYYFAADMPAGHLLGLDKDHGKIEIAKASSKHMKNIEYLCMDAGKIDSLKRDQWDVIVANDLFHHIDYGMQDEVISKSGAILKKGGLFIVKDVHPAPSLWQLFNTIHDRTFNKAPVLYYKTIDSYIANMERNSMRVEFIKHFYTLPFSNIFIIGRKV